MANDFFEERTEQSELKARIVQKYFDAWAKVMMATLKQPGSKIAYIDLCAGPGRYQDGAASTPLLVLEKAINDPRLSKMLVVLLNDMEEKYATTLRNEIAVLPGASNLAYPPVVYNETVNEEMEQYFSNTKLMPSFSFIDPFGYKILSQKIIHGVIKDWGCDCVFFFNYNRINAGLSNEIFKAHLDDLFGEARANALRIRIEGKSPFEREALILEEFAHALRDLGGKYVLPFRFKNTSGTRTSHFLIFVSKHPLGYKIMKNIMAAESSVEDQGVPSFTYSPADEATPLLFSLARPLDALEGMLIKEFQGQSLSMIEVFENHNIDTPYVERNYKDALLMLESKGRIVCNPPAAKRRKNTFGNNVVITFPGGNYNGE